MKPRPHPLSWLPPFILGVCAATAAEVAAGLLLYAGPGLLRSLTTILSVEALALALGVITVPGTRPELVDSLRRRWLFCLLAFMGATLFSAFWSVAQAVGGSALGQGLGLALLAGLPMYALGGVLGAMSAVAAAESGERVGAVGGSALLGSALGFAATGVSLPQVFTPASLLLVCLVLLSAGGLVYGSVLDARLRVHVRAKRPSPLGEVRVEDRHLLSRDSAARVLLEGDFVRSMVTLAEDQHESWEQAVCHALRSPVQNAGPVLFLGGGASPQPRTLVREDATVRVEVAERSGAVLELGREHLDTGLHAAADERLVVLLGNLEDILAGEDGRYSSILLDTAAFGPVGGVASMSVSARSRIFRRLDPGGVLALGPLRPEPGTWTFPEGWSEARYRRGHLHDVGALGIAVPAEELIWAGSPDAQHPWPPTVGSFVRVIQEG